MTNEIIKTTASFLARTKVTLIQHSPKILMGLGLAAGTGALVTAIRGTLKAQPVIDEIKTDLADIHCEIERAEENNEDTTALKKQLTSTYLHAAGDMLKIYAPTIILAGASAACVLTSHNIMLSRNIALATAFASVEEEYKKYRERVADKIGTEAEQAIYRDEIVREEEASYVDEKTGEVKTEKVKKYDYQLPAHAGFFDNTNPNYVNDPANNYNLMFIQIQEQFCNDKLRVQGFLFENDARELLGLKKTEGGQRCGWVYDPNGPTHQISFGIDDYTANHGKNIMDDGIWIDFNVDGDIMNKVVW